MSSKRRRRDFEDDADHQADAGAVAGAAELSGKMKALNSTFFEWVKEQHTTAPATLWSSAAQDYIDYAKEIIDQYRSTVEQLAKTLGAGEPAPKRRDTQPLFGGSNGSSGGPSTSAAPLFAQSTSAGIGAAPTASLFGPSVPAAGGASGQAAAPLFGTGAAGDGGALSVSLFPSMAAAGAAASGGDASGSKLSLGFAHASSDVSGSAAASAGAFSGSTAALGGAQQASLFPTPGAAPDAGFLGAGGGGASGGASGGGFLFGPSSSTGTSNAFAALQQAGGDGDGGGGGGDEAAEDEEPSQVVELKGNASTEMLFTGKCKVQHKRDGAWAGLVVGTLTVRRDKESRKSWLQVNTDQGKILRYAMVVPDSRFTVRETPTKEGQGTRHFISLSANVFDQPPDEQNPSPEASVTLMSIQTTKAHVEPLTAALASAGYKAPS